MRRTRLGRRKGKFFGMVVEFNVLVFVVTALILAFGAVCGVFMLNGISNADFEGLLGIWGVAAGEEYKDGFFEGFFKHGAVVFGIWLCGFFRIGIIGVIMLIFAKGASIGFTSAFIIKCMGDEGFFMIFRLCFFRDFFMIFLCLAAGVFAVRRYIDDKNFTEKKVYYTIGAALFTGVFAVCALI